VGFNCHFLRKEAILMIRTRAIVNGILVCLVATVCAVLIVNGGMLLGLKVKGSGEVVSVYQSNTGIGNTVMSFTTINFKNGGSYVFYGNEDLALGNHTFQAHYGWWDQLILDTYL
jgi:hypothetical protein